MAWRLSLSIGLVVGACASPLAGDGVPPADAEAGAEHARHEAGTGPVRVRDADAGSGSGDTAGAIDASNERDSGPDGTSSAATSTSDAAAADPGAPSPCAGASCDPEEATCTVVQGAAVCRCLPGYRDLQGKGERCEDIDECETGAARCATSARCMNLPGNYTCVCDPGFHGDGVTPCEPNAACTPERSETQCGAGASCVVLGDAGHCWCPSRFEGDGVSCSERDDCARDLDDCHPLAQCENFRGDYTCRCPQHHLGDGHGGAGCFLPPSRLSAPRIPAPSGDCPVFAPGTSTIPQLLGVRLQVGAKPSAPSGALLFYWHGSGSHATEADTMLPAAMRQDILNAGGIIAAFESSGQAGGDCSGTKTFARGDIQVADLITACAVRDHNVDPRRIYVTGCTAGGFQAGCMAVTRSSYVAAVATNSGGIIQRMAMRAAHAPAAITLNGGVGGPLLIDTTQTSKTLNKLVLAFGGFAVDCNHGGGFCGAPAELYLAAWQFMKDHPFGLAESPYAGGLPASFPAYCSVQR